MLVDVHLCNYPQGIKNTGVNEMTLGMQNLYAVAFSSHNPRKIRVLVDVHLYVITLRVLKIQV